MEIIRMCKEVNDISMRWLSVANYILHCHKPIILYNYKC